MAISGSGTDGAGALRYAGDRFVTFTVKDGLCSDQVMSFTTDGQGDLWLGTYGSGICRNDGMAMISTFDGLPNNTVWCGLHDDQDRLWFGTSDGLCRLGTGSCGDPGGRSGTRRPTRAIPVARSRRNDLVRNTRWSDRDTPRRKRVGAHGRCRWPRPFGAQHGRGWPRADLDGDRPGGARARQWHVHVHRHEGWSFGQYGVLPAAGFTGPYLGRNGQWSFVPDRWAPHGLAHSP